MSNLSYCGTCLNYYRKGTVHDCGATEEKKMAEWYCNNCKQKFYSEYMHEHHVCSGVTENISRSQMIKCDRCGNRMMVEAYKNHACRKNEKTSTPGNGMRIGVFVSPRRLDSSSMRLAATEFSNANYIVRGIEAEKPFINVAKEMKSSIHVVTAKTVRELDNEILLKSDLAILFPSSHAYNGKEILKFPVIVGEKKTPVIVYPER